MYRIRRNRLFLLFAVLVSLVASGCGSGQFLGPTITPSPTQTLTPAATLTPSPTATLTPTLTLSPTQTQPAGDASTLTGRLLASRTNKPLSGAKVNLVGAGSNVNIPEVQTDADGRYTLEDIQAGQYTMSIQWVISDISLWPCTTKPPAGQIVFVPVKAEITAGENWVLVLGSPEAGKNAIIMQGDLNLAPGDSKTLDVTVTSC